MDESLKEKILKLRQDGFTYDQIKNQLKCSKSVISYHCRREGLDKKYNFSYLQPTDEEKKIMQILYDEIKSSSKVSEQTGWSKATVLKYIKTEKKQKNSEEFIKKKKIESVISWRKRTKIKLIDYMGGKCRSCGYNKCVGALEFHHINPKEKDFNISGKSWSYEKLKSEVDKCILLCNRCHTEVHYGLIDINQLVIKV